MPNPNRRHPFALALAIVCLLVMWAYTAKFSTLQLLPLSEVPGRPYPSDLLPPWHATSALLDKRENPYTPEVTASIQKRLFGRELRQSDSRATDQQRFAYPIYTVLLLAPFRQIRFDTAANIARLLLPIIVALSVLMWLKLLGNRSYWFASAVVAFSLASWPVAQGVALQQLGFVVFLLISAALLLACRHHLVLSGVLLAIASIKPQAVYAPAGWLVIWSLGDLRRRWQVTAAFISGVLALVIAGELLLPGWISDWLATVKAYSSYAATGTLMSLLFGPVGTAVNITIGAITAWALWKRRHVPASSDEFVYCAITSMAVGLLLSPVWVSHSQIALIPAAILIWKFRTRLQQSLEGKLLFYTGTALQGWSWLGSLLIIAGVFATTQGRVWSLAPATIGLPIILVACLGLLLSAKHSSAAPGIP